MAIGFGRLHFSPAEFWAMTPREFNAALNGLSGRTGTIRSLTRTELQDLAARFPDQSDP